jgi:putative ATP-dependent endonuclease of OLD family
MHLLKNIEIKNFKSCTESKFILSDYTPLAGYNNRGKSNILNAIR